MSNTINPTPSPLEYFLQAKAERAQKVSQPKKEAHPYLIDETDKALFIQIRAINAYQQEDFLTTIAKSLQARKQINIDCGEFSGDEAELTDLQHGLWNADDYEETPAIFFVVNLFPHGDFQDEVIKSKFAQKIRKHGGPDFKLELDSMLMYNQIGSLTPHLMMSLESLETQTDQTNSNIAGSHFDADKDSFNLFQDRSSEKLECVKFNRENDFPIDYSVGSKLMNMILMYLDEGKTVRLTESNKTEETDTIDDAGIELRQNKNHITITLTSLESLNDQDIFIPLANALIDKKKTVTFKKLDFIGNEESHCITISTSSKNTSIKIHATDADDSDFMPVLIPLISHFVLNSHFVAIDFTKNPQDSELSSLIGEVEARADVEIHLITKNHKDKRIYILKVTN